MSELEQKSDLIDKHLPLTRYWLTMFKLGGTMLETFSVAKTDQLTAAIQEESTDSKAIIKVFIDEDIDEDTDEAEDEDTVKVKAFAAISASGETEDTAIARSVATFWSAIEFHRQKQTFLHPQTETLYPIEVRVVDYGLIGKSSLENIWPSMEDANERYNTTMEEIAAILDVNTDEDFKLFFGAVTTPKE